MDNGDTNTRRDGEELPAPAKLVAALKEPPARRVFVPPAIDITVLRAARQHFTKPERSLVSFLRLRVLWPTVAAMCLIVALMLYVFMNPSGAKRDFAREDINHDGRIDIIDAFQLARETQPGSRPAATSDLNHDGTVDHYDVELIAKQAVSLEKGGKS